MGGCRSLLAKVRELAGSDSSRQADETIRVLVAAVRSLVPRELAEQVMAAVHREPGGREGFHGIYPEDILEREGLVFEGMDPEPEMAAAVIAQAGRRSSPGA